MKAYTTERVLVEDDESPVYGRCRIIIRVDDQSGRPYLVIRGENLEPDTGETSETFYLQSEEEIDMFAAECKAMLRQASKE